MSSERIVAGEPIAPLACPPSLNPIEVRGLFVALVSLIVISSFALAYSFVRPRTTQEGNLQANTSIDMRTIWAVIGIVAGAVVAAAGILDGFVTLCPLETGCSGSYPSSVLPLLIAGAVVLALSVAMLGLAFMKPKTARSETAALTT
jgi:hypothetical protein